MLKLDLQPAHARILRDLLDRHVPEAEVWAYGSRVTGQAHESSDLDIVLRNPGQLNQPQKNLSQLREAMRESNLPILVEVLDWARIPESFRREIEGRHVPVRSGETAVPK